MKNFIKRLSFEAAGTYLKFVTLNLIVN